MSWIEVSLQVTPDSAEAVGQVLIEQGSLGVWERDADAITAYFPSDTDRARLQAILEAVQPWLKADLPSLAEVPDQDWVARWKASLLPLRVTSRLVIVPSWLTYQAEPGERVVVLDPGMAFGTGHHETTRMCLEFLDERLQRGDAPSVLDLGTGSGILAIAAARLGAGRVVAADIDPEARAVAEANVTCNDVGSIVTVTDAESACLSAPFDLIVANLTAEVLADLSRSIGASLAPAGEAILSGILTSREPIVNDAIEQAGLQVMQHQQQGEWTALMVERAVDFPQRP